MPRARLVVDLPADSWMGALTREFPAVDWRLTATGSDGRHCSPKAATETRPSLHSPLPTR